MHTPRHRRKAPPPALPGFDSSTLQPEPEHPVWGQPHERPHHHPRWLVPSLVAAVVVLTLMVLALLSGSHGTPR
jgi:hypothetical protein